MLKSYCCFPHLLLCWPLRLLKLRLLLRVMLLIYQQRQLIHCLTHPTPLHPPLLLLPVAAAAAGQQQVMQTMLGRG
jgi:hypothetical protein